MKKVIVLVFLLLIKFQARAQLFDRTKEGPEIRSYVLKLGPMKDRPLSDLIDSFRAQKYNEVKMTYAIYSWIAENVAFDSKGFKNPNKAVHTTTATLKNRTATSEGYAQLFKTMCDVANIKCYIIKGIVKTHPAQIGKSDAVPEHSWNVVFIKNLLLFVDVTLGAGTTDVKGGNFTKEFTDAWFFTNKDLFWMNHYTKDRSSPLPVESIPPKADFLRAPIIYKAAVILDLFPSPTTKGKLRSRQGMVKTLDFSLRNSEVSIRSVSIVTKYGEVAIPVKRYEDVLAVEIPFAAAGEYGVTLKVNGANAFGFMASVSENKR